MTTHDLGNSETMSMVQDTTTSEMNVSRSWNLQTTTSPFADDIPPISKEVLWMLGCFSAIGTLGNSLVLYGFSRMLRKNLTSTVFILTLAGTDLLTSLLIIPGTIYMEHVRYYISNDLFCKGYHFLLTTTVPYSMFLMVAIAIDRYLCICRPFLHCMNMKRARTLVTVLSIFAILLGITASLFYGIISSVEKPQNSTNSKQSVDLLSSSLDEILNVTNDVYPDKSNISDITHKMNPVDRQSRADQLTMSYVYMNLSDIVDNVTGYTHNTLRGKPEILKCERNIYILGENFQYVFQRMYSSLFLIAVVIVSCLYILIYRAVMLRRRKTQRLRMSNISTCSQIVPTDELDTVNGTVVNNEDTPMSPIGRMCRKLSLRRGSKLRKSSKRSDKAFLENMRTAITLFIVTVVFIIVFLPGWLMALRIIDTYVSVFYLYFLHGVINPFIYAFMNETFRKTIRYLWKCGNRGGNDATHVIGGMSQTTC